MKLTKQQLTKIIREELGREGVQERTMAPSGEFAGEVSKGGDPRPKIQQNFADLANTVYHFDDATIPLLTGLVDNLDGETAEAAKDLLQRVQQLKSDMRKYSGV